MCSVDVRWRFDRRSLAGRVVGRAEEPKPFNTDVQGCSLDFRSMIYRYSYVISLCSIDASIDVRLVFYGCSIDVRGIFDPWISVGS